jgi:hypothetical protein
MNVMCAVVFLIFTFSYLFFYQADILAVGQHVLSRGMTHYNNTIGAILITVILYLLQIVIFSITKLNKRAHALTYFPSLLLLTIITDVSPSVDKGFSFGGWIIAFPIIICIYIIIVWMSKQFQPYEPDINSTGLFSRMMWINLLIMVVMFILVGVLSNSNDIFHERMRAEVCITKNDYDGALYAEEKSQTPDSSLTMLRALALSHKQQLGERLFEYPVTGGSAALLPNGISVKAMLIQQSEIYNYLGVRLKQNLKPMSYFNYLMKHKLAKKPVIDYILCGYLMDKKLDEFAREVCKYYNIKAKLPKHYREALILYTHIRSHPFLIYKNAVTDADFQDLLDITKQNADKLLRKNIIRDSYGNTYWYYYWYC